MPVGADRYELYCEEPDEVLAADEPPSGVFRRLVHRFREMLAEAERERRRVFPAISGASKVEALEALGIVESFSVASLIEGADAAVKAANVQLIEIRLAMALGGKAFVTLTGNVAAVQAAVDAAAGGRRAEGNAGQ